MIYRRRVTRVTGGAGRRHKRAGGTALLRTNRLFHLLWVGLLALCLQAGGCAGTPTSQSSVRIGVIDAQRVLSETRAGRKAKDALDTFTKNRQALMALEERELKRMEANLLKQASVLTANARRQREERFRRRMLQYQQKAVQLNQEVQDKQREVLEGFRDMVEKTVAAVAQELSLVLVIEKGRGGPTVYSDASIDISDRVIQALNKGTN